MAYSSTSPDGISRIPSPLLTPYRPLSFEEGVEDKLASTLSDDDVLAPYPPPTPSRLPLFSEALEDTSADLLSKVEMFGGPSTWVGESEDYPGNPVRPAPISRPTSVACKYKMKFRHINCSGPPERAYTFFPDCSRWIYCLQYETRWHINHQLSYLHRELPCR
jgi:hypothetical protein